MKEEKSSVMQLFISLPNVTISGTLHAVLEEVRGHPLALLLVILCHWSISVRVAFWSNLELRPALLGGLRGHRGIEVAAIAWLSRSTCSAGALGGRRGLARVVRGSTSATEVLVRELVNKAVRRVVGGRSRSLLVCSLRSLGIGRRCLLAVSRRVRIVREVSLATAITSRVLLLLSRLRMGLLSALALGLEDRVGEGGGGRRVGARVRNELVVVVPEIQVQTIGVGVIHSDG